MSDKVEITGGDGGSSIPVELTISLDDESVEALVDALSQRNG